MIRTFYSYLQVLKHLDLLGEYSSGWLIMLNVSSQIPTKGKRNVRKDWKTNFIQEYSQTCIFLFRSSLFSRNKPLVVVGVLSTCDCFRPDEDSFTSGELSGWWSMTHGHRVEAKGDSFPPTAISRAGQCAQFLSGNGSLISIFTKKLFFKGQKMVWGNDYRRDQNMLVFVPCLCYSVSALFLLVAFVRDKNHHPRISSFTVSISVSKHLFR